MANLLDVVVSEFKFQSCYQIYFLIPLGMVYTPLLLQHMAVQKQDDQHEHTFSNYVRIRDVVQKTCQRR